LSAALRSLADEELSVVVRTANPSTVAGGRKICVLRLTGADHEGIVHKITAILAKLDINVETMETGLVPAPMSATPLFSMDAQISVPVDVDQDSLQAHFEQIADELGVDLTVESADTA
jgi:glycine cleavage system regulatory protein